MTVREIVISSVEPPLEAVLGRLGYNKNKSQLDESLFSQIKSEIATAINIAEPKAHILDQKIISTKDDSITIESGLVFFSAKLAKILAKSKSVSLFACTIGEKLTIETEKLLREGQAARSVILDAAGSETVEAFADYISEVLQREKKLFRLKPAMRYSPGYGDLKTNVHKELLPLLESAEIGITSNPDNFILKPEKSITAIIGWE
jgi:hypothetical protein